MVCPSGRSSVSKGTSELSLSPASAANPAWIGPGSEPQMLPRTSGRSSDLVAKVAPPLVCPPPTQSHGIRLGISSNPCLAANAPRRS